MARAEREKGVRGEREVVAILRRWGFACDRSPNSGGLFIPGDVVGVEGYHIEVKRQERLRLPEWLEQARSEAPPNTLPVVVWRRSRDEWYAALPLADLLYLIQRPTVDKTVDAVGMADELLQQAKRRGDS